VQPAGQAPRCRFIGLLLLIVIGTLLLTPIGGRALRAAQQVWAMSTGDELTIECLTTLIGTVENGQAAFECIAEAAAAPTPTADPTLPPTIEPTFGRSAAPDAAPTVIIIESEAYDAGPAGEAYFDTTPGDNRNVFRDDRDVDIGPCCGGYKIIYVTTGEWLRYTIDVPVAATYTIRLQVATTYLGGQVHLEVDGAPLSGPVAVPRTPNWSSWKPVDLGSVPLAAGRHVLRVVVDRGGFDMDRLELAPVSDATAPAPTATAQPAPPTAAATAQPAPPTATATAQPAPPTATATAQLVAPATPAHPTPHHHMLTTTPPPSEAPLLPAPQTIVNHGPWFQIVCSLGVRRNDDPIVHPGQPGASHEHQFFGATGIDAHSTYASLTAAGTTCADRGDTAGYWVPTLYDENGIMRQPKRVRAYYYANTSTGTTVQPFPANLRIIAGSAQSTGPQPIGAIHWLCRNRLNQSAMLPLASNDPPRCDPDEFLSLSISFPDCWDGVHLDSSDHRRHMAYADSQRRCPASHPVKVPRMRLSITYEDAAFTGGAFTLGAPRGHPMALPSYAMHADFWNTWQQSALNEYVEGCLRSARTVRNNPCTR
jgi:hypothetical protein